MRAGEVLGIGGVAGNGQDELLLALSGEMRTAAGMVRLKGEPIGPARPDGAAAAGPALRAGGTDGPCQRPGHDA